MAQGVQKIKKSQTKSNSQLSRRAGITKRGAKVVAPKKKTLVVQAKKKKAISAVLTAGTEKRLAEKAGHTEMVEAKKQGKTQKQPRMPAGGKK